MSNFEPRPMYEPRHELRASMGYLLSYWDSSMAQTSHHFRTQESMVELLEALIQKIKAGENVKVQIGITPDMAGDMEYLTPEERRRGGL